MRNYPPEAMGPKNQHECYVQTPASDLYMLGLVMWEMLNVKLVWNHYPTSGANQRVQAGEKPEFEEGVKDKIPQEVIALIYRCLEFNPVDRPTFSELALSLRTLHA